MLRRKSRDADSVPRQWLALEKRSPGLDQNVVCINQLPRSKHIENGVSQVIAVSSKTQANPDLAIQVGQSPVLSHVKIEVACVDGGRWQKVKKSRKQRSAQ